MRRALILLRRRLIGAVPVLLLVVIGTFFLLEAAGGDAVDAYIVSTGGDAGLIEALRQRWGLDQSAVTRLANYLWALAHLDLGWSVTFSRPILDVIRERLPNTLLLMGSATALSFSLGSALGIVAGARPGSFRDRLLSVGSLALYADSRLLARAGADRGVCRATALAAAGRHRIDRLGQDRACPRRRHRPPSGAAGGRTRLHLSRALSAHHARRDGRNLAHGFRARRQGARHVAPAHRARPCRAQRAAAAVVTVLGLQSAAMLGGSVVIETVFSVPGLGRLAQEAVASRDTPLLLGIILVSAVLVISINLVVDVIYAVLDPRIGSGEPA